MNTNRILNSGNLPSGGVSQPQPSTARLRAWETWNLAPRAAVLAMCLLAASSVRAANYDVQHNFRLRPGGNVVPQVQAVYYAHAWAQTSKPDCARSDVVPKAPPQPLGWNPFGRDRLTARFGVRNSGGVDSQLGRQNVGAGGLPRTTWTATAACGATRGVANSQITVNPFGAGTPVTGTIRAFGSATAVAPPPRSAAAYAFSMAMVEARGGRQMRNGTIRWGKVVRDVVSGQAQARRQVDPVDYTVQDLATGEVFQGTLYSVDMEITNSPSGGFIWESNQVQIVAQNVTFRVSFPSPLTSLQGKLDVQVQNGVVVGSTGAGFFAGSAPPVGATVPLTFAVPNEIEFDYDLGDFNGNDLDVGIDMYGAGEASEQAATDEPSLTITRLDDSVLTVEYYLTERPYVLQSSPTVDPQAPWADVTAPPMILEDRVIYHLPLDPTAPALFFRLRGEGGTGDTTPPSFTVLPQCGAPMLLVEFSEPVEPLSAMHLAHYSLMSMPPLPIEVFAAELVGPETVMLQVAPPLQPGFTYVLQVQGVSDLAGNAIPPGTTTTFTCGSGPR